ncbi:MAG: hypothetical protein PHD48_07740 [Alphaproteobacteria bacterium]|nr:hypothetical protein [Alphaproteobacteria bacterium]
MPHSIEFREGNDFKILTGRDEHFFLENFSRQSHPTMRATDYKNSAVKIASILPLAFQGIWEDKDSFGVEARDPQGNLVTIISSSPQKELCAVFDFNHNKSSLSVVHPTRFFATEDGYFGFLRRSGMNSKILRVPQIAHYSARFVGTMFKAES